MTAVPNVPIAVPEDISAREAARTSQVGDLFTTGEFRLTALIFIFAMIAMGVFYMLLRTERATPYVMRIFVIIILVFGTLLIVSSAYSTDQIAPVVGFFGTIAGYLLGRSERSGDREP